MKIDEPDTPFVRELEPPSDEDDDSDSDSDSSDPEEARANGVRRPGGVPIFRAEDLAAEALARRNRQWLAVEQQPAAAAVANGSHRK